MKACTKGGGAEWLKRKGWFPEEIECTGLGERLDVEDEGEGGI